MLNVPVPLWPLLYEKRWWFNSVPLQYRPGRLGIPRLVRSYSFVGPGCGLRASCTAGRCIRHWTRKPSECHG